MNIAIKEEIPEYHKVTEKVIKNAFVNMEFSDKREHELVSTNQKIRSIHLQNCL